MTVEETLESLVRPIRVAPGQLEIALEPGAHPGLHGEIARKLEAFTGMRWMVMVAKDGGEKPVEAMKTVFGRFFDLLEHVPDGDDDGRDVFRIVIFAKR